jgi:hypothetical protein
MSITVRPVRTKAERADFLDLPYTLHRHDPQWVPPLRFERADLINPKKNPFFEHGEAELFVAYKGNKPVGRISAQYDRLHHERYNEKAGFFGFLDAIDDQDVFNALWAATEQWHRAKGHTKIVGPYSFTINGESGVLVDGFETPPSVLMNHNPRYYPRRIEALGLAKAKDLYAWHYVAGDVSEPATALAQYTQTAKGLKVRNINPKELQKEVRVIMQIFNEAWSNNWGYLPFTEAELRKMGEELQLILDPRIVFIAEVDGEPAAMALSMPNVNSAIKDLDGKLFPLGLAKLLYRLKVKGVNELRLVLLGIRPQFRGRDDLKGLSVLLYYLTHTEAKKAGYHIGELSWTLEDNWKINRGIEMMGGKLYKTYRLYEKVL